MTSLHRRLAKGIHLPADARVFQVDAARTSEPWRILMTLPRIIIGLLRCAFERNATVVIPHPFHPVLALFCRVAEDLILYDDGTAYYIDSKVPDNRRVQLYKRLSSRLFNWDSSPEAPESDFRDMVESSRATQLFAIYPQMQEYASVQVLPIDLNAAFQAKRQKHCHNSLLLDTHRDVSPRGGDAGRIVAYFEDLSGKQNSPIWYRPHPTGLSEMGRLLEGKPWVRIVEENLEDFLEDNCFTDVYSFYSTGAVVAKLLSSETNLLNLPNARMNAIAPKNKIFFTQIGAVDVDL